MKDSVLKIAALAMMVIVFAAVAITARWIGDSDYDHISRPCQGSDEVSSGASSCQASRVSTEAGTWDAVSRSELSTVWAAGHDSSSDDQKQSYRSTAERRAAWRSNHPKKEHNDGGEPPDGREDKDVWRNADIE